MEIKYIVNGKEFATEKEARKYEKQQIINNALYEVNQTVYYPTSSGKLVQAVIKSINVQATSDQKMEVVYYFKHSNKGKLERNVYPTTDVYCEYLKDNIFVL